jgi:hypothetical protein
MNKQRKKTSRLRSKGHPPGLQMVSSWGGETEFCVSSPSYKDTNPHTSRTSRLWHHLSLLTSQRLPLQTPAHCFGRALVYELRSHDPVPGKGCLPHLLSTTYMQDHGELSRKSLGSLSPVEARLASLAPTPGGKCYSFPAHCTASHWEFTMTFQILILSWTWRITAPSLGHRFSEGGIRTCHGGEGEVLCYIQVLCPPPHAQFCRLSLFYNNHSLREGWALWVLQGLMLVKQSLHHLNHTPVFFCYLLFSERVSHFCPQLTAYCDSPSYSLQSSWDHRCILPYLLVEMESATFCLSWPWTMILLVSIFWVDGISHCNQLQL